MKKKGFTLVELSIVLVIIGLLIGGILAAQSMIKTAKITGIIKDLGQYDAAFSLFRSKYNGTLPGDTTLFPSGGNDDKVVDTYEFPQYWYHLSLGVSLKKKNTNLDFIQGGDPFAEQLKDSCPQFDIEQDQNEVTCLVVASQQYRYFEGPYAVAPTNAPMRAVDLAAIDAKIDDGKAQTGSVKVGYWGSLGPEACANFSNTYAVDNTNFACVPIIDMGIQSGDKITN